MKEKEQYLGLLRQLKDFNEERSRVLAAQAYQEQERKRLEVSMRKRKLYDDISTFLGFNDIKPNSTTARQVR